MIHTEFFEETVFVSDPGSRFREVYTPNLCKDGRIELVVTGKEDLVEYMNSFKDSCDPAVLVERFLAGDVSALSVTNPVFLDVLGAPKTLAEAYAINYRAEHAFENLPSEIKAKFGNSYYDFISKAGSDEWLSALQMKSEDNSGSEVKEDAP